MIYVVNLSYGWDGEETIMATADREKAITFAHDYAPLKAPEIFIYELEDGVDPGLNHEPFYRRSR